jgi:hypothetical protein
VKIRDVWLLKGEITLDNNSCFFFHAQNLDENSYEKLSFAGEIAVSLELLL